MKIERIRNACKKVFKKNCLDKLNLKNESINFCMPSFVEGKTNLSEWIKTGITGFKEWYQPVDFGDGLIAHVTTPPDWQESPDLDAIRGMAKWDFIVKRNIPDVTGKRVLDVGCNNGVFSLQLAKNGASEVIGIDRDITITQKSTDVLPKQNIIEQANFVKHVFEIKDRKKYPIEYIVEDFSNINVSKFGRFDLIIALCVVYHQLRDTPKIIKALSEMTDHLILQTTLLHPGELGYWADPYRLAELLNRSGFSKIEIDSPQNYSWPMIIGKRN